MATKAEKAKARQLKAGSLMRPRVSDYIIAVIILILSLTCILPFLHVASKSISSNRAVLSKEVFLWPVDVNVDAYGSILRDGQMTWSLGYTVVITLLFTLIGMIITICAAYPLARKGLKGRPVFAFIFMFTMYFSAGLIPEYLLINSLNLLDNPWSLILPLCFAPYNMLIMRSFLVSTIPDSLYEAAELDGANNFQTLFKVVLPLSKSIIATLSLFYAVGRWNAYADAKYYITSRKWQPIQYLLSAMVNSAGGDAMSLSDPNGVTSTPEVLQAAAIMFATIPILLVYPFVQKYFVKGVMIGAVKG